MTTEKICQATGMDWKQFKLDATFDVVMGLLLAIIMYILCSFLRQSRRRK